MQKFVTFTTYDNEDPQVLHISDFTSDCDFDEWVWHLAPSQEAALARHWEAREAFKDQEFEYFDHSAPPPGWDHGLDLSISIITRRWDGSEITGTEIRTKLNELLELSDDQLRDHFVLFDTIHEYRP